ncbi:hypothetical protein A2U01_0046818, partial [Trifolium medium]|nr:hypothetical protein [Trifolium medium]
MRTITPEERRKFLAKARQQKTNPAPGQPEPLSQLVVEDEASRGGKRKKKIETRRVSMAIPGKDGASTTTTGGETIEVVPSPSKKRKISTTQPGRKLVLTPGATAVVSEARDSDRHVPVSDQDV